MKKIIERLNNRLVKNLGTDCWEFTGYRDKWGYGQISQQNPHKMIFVHRYSYWYYKLKPLLKELSEDTLILHKCDNPSCCNPDHLFEGSHKDNIRDKLSKNRQAKGTANGRSKLSSEQVIEIYKMKSPISKIALKFSVSPGTVSGIKNNREWVWLTQTIILE